MPLYRRLPKRGFWNPFSTDLNEVNLGRIQEAVDAKKLDAGQPVTVEALVAAGVCSKPRDGVKILGDGELTAKLAFEVLRRVEVGVRRPSRRPADRSRSSRRGGGSGGLITGVSASTPVTVDDKPGGGAMIPRSPGVALFWSAGALPRPSRHIGAQYGIGG